MRRRLLISTPLLGACSAFDYRAPDAPEPLTTVPPLQPAPRRALVLGAGGPRGYAHLGVLRVLEEEAGWVPDLIVGSSVGALIGVFWASGLNAAQLDALSRSGGPFTLFDLNPFADRGWIRGQRLQDYVQAGVQGRALHQLPRQVVVVVTRKRDKAARFIRCGHAGVAVRASSAVPGIVSPVGIGGEEYEDGDESLPLAVRAARQAGAQQVVAVNVYPTVTPPTPARRSASATNAAAAPWPPRRPSPTCCCRPTPATRPGPSSATSTPPARRAKRAARAALPQLRAL